MPRRATRGPNSAASSVSRGPYSRATEHDVPLILQLIKDLAEYERMSDEVVATEQGLRESLFGARPAAEVIIGYAAIS